MAIDRPRATTSAPHPAPTPLPVDQRESRGNAGPAESSEPPSLRDRIVRTAHSLLEDGGLEALSMREVARRAGVTHQAPYHHFGDRAGIVAALVAEGFDDLAGRLARAADPASASGVTWLRASGEAYIGFALDRPGLFRLMFRPEQCDLSSFPAARDAGTRAWSELERMVRAIHPGRPSEPLASLYWAQVHGLAGLLTDGPMGIRHPDRAARLAHARSVLDLLAAAMLPRG